MRQESTVGQPREGIIKGEPLNFIFRFFAHRDVRHRQHIVCDLSLGILNRSHGQMLWIILTTLAPIFDLAFPMALGPKNRPHTLTIEPRVVLRKKHLRGLARHVRWRKARDAGKRMIDLQDLKLSVSHHHPFLGLKRSGGDTQLFFGPRHLGDIGRHATQSNRHTAIVAKREFHRHQPPWASESTALDHLLGSHCFARAQNVLVKRKHRIGHSMRIEVLQRPAENRLVAQSVKIRQRSIGERETMVQI